MGTSDTSRARAPQSTERRRGDARLHASGRWEARYRHPITGKRTGAYGATAAEAEAERSRILAEAMAGLPALDRRTTVRSLVRGFIRAQDDGGARANTLSSYRSVARRIDRLEWFATMRVHLVTAEHVQDAVAAWRAEGLSVATIRTYTRVLGAAFQHFVEQGRLHRNVVRYVRLPAQDHSAGTIPTKGEVRAIMDAAHDYHYGLAVVLPLFAGLRQGEVLGLRWGDLRPQVDRQGRPIAGTLAVHVARNWARPTGPDGMPATWGPTKSKAGVRQVPIPNDSPVMPFLHALRDLTFGEGVTPHPDAWLFPSSLAPDRPIGTRTLHEAWTVIRRRAQVRPALRFHDLRHAFAVALLDSGVSMYDVSVLLGHSGPTITHLVYGHRDRAVLAIPADLYGTGVAGA